LAKAVNSSGGEKDVLFTEHLKGGKSFLFAEHYGQRTKFIF
jgi:hypothetical protein